jgi:hypothetical protein
MNRYSAQKQYARALDAGNQDFTDVVIQGQYQVRLTYESEMFF